MRWLDKDGSSGDETDIWSLSGERTSSAESSDSELVGEERSRWDEAAQTILEQKFQLLKNPSFDVNPEKAVCKRTAIEYDLTNSSNNSE